MGDYDTALRMMESAKLVPLDPEDLQLHVSRFHTVQPEVGDSFREWPCMVMHDRLLFQVRVILPDLCVALMRCLVALHEAARLQRDGGRGAGAINPGEDREEMMQRMKAYAKTMILYSAMIPHRFPVSTNSTLLQLQAHIA